MHSPVQTIPVPARRFAHVHADLVGPFPVSKEGFTHLFTMVDRSTRWAEAVPLASVSTADCAAALFTGWVSRFGVPELLTSDRGAQFTSAVWTALCSKLGIRHVPTTAYHPQSNGMVERFHRQLKNSLRSRLCGPDWSSHLPWVLLGLRAAPKEDSGTSSAEMVYGAALTLPGQFLSVPEPPAEDFLTSLQEIVRGFQPPPMRLPPRRSEVPGELLRARFVFVRRECSGSSLEPLFDGPFEVERSGGKSEAITVDRHKPYLGEAPPTVAVLPRKGRPPASSMKETHLYSEVVRSGRGQPD